LEHARLVAQLLLRFLNSSKGSIPDAAVARLCAVPLGCRGDLGVKEILLEGGFDVESDRSTFRKSRLMVIFHFLPTGIVFESRITSQNTRIVVLKWCSELCLEVSAMFLPGCATLCEGRSSSAMVSSCYVCYGQGSARGWVV